MDNPTTSNNLMQQVSRSILVSDGSSISTGSSLVTLQPSFSLMSVHSANEMGNSCRICRWHQRGLQVVQCPCQCKGSVGYVHLRCLYRWMLQKGENRCEICGAKFNLNQENCSYKQMFRSFFQTQYLGAILHNFMNIVLVAPIPYIILYQFLQIMENLQLEDNNNWEIVFIAPTLLISSGFILFHILEFGLTRCFGIKNALKHWWTFGGQETDPGLDIEMDVPSYIFQFF